MAQRFAEHQRDNPTVAYTHASLVLVAEHRDTGEVELDRLMRLRMESSIQANALTRMAKRHAPTDPTDFGIANQLPTPPIPSTEPPCYQ